MSPWKKTSEELPNKNLGTVLYRLKKEFRGDRWFVGLAYFTVSDEWGIDSSGSMWPPDTEYDVEWMEIPE